MQQQSSSRPLALAAPLVAALTSAPWLAPTPALADEPDSTSSRGGIDGFIAAGVAAVPDFEGSSNYEPVPLIVGQIDTLGLRFELEGLVARVNFRPDSALQLGPIIAFRPGRDDVQNDVVDRLADVDGAVEVGGFVRYEFTDLFHPSDGLELGVQVAADVADGHDGLTVTAGTGYARSFGDRWRLGVDAEVTWASDNYMQSFFSIDAADAAASGLARFQADSGVKDIGAGVTAIYSFSDRWGVLGRIGYTRLLGDAADSPIVDVEGTPNQVFGGLAVSYRF